MNPTEPISVEQIAISNAKSLFGKLKDGDQLFQSCISQTASISQLIQYVNETNCSHKRKTSSKLLEQFQRNTEGLQSFSYAIELAVQAKADIFCPLWAPVKLILQISKSHSIVVRHVTAMVEALIENLARLELYQKLQKDPGMQIELLFIFNDIANFCVEALCFFQRRTLVRIWKLMMSSQKASFQNSVDRLKSHIQGVYDTAVAIELARQRDHDQEQDRLRKINSLGAANMREAHQKNVRARTPNTCKWIISHATFVQWETSQSPDANDRLLFISGKRGCGKSTLASFIIEELKARRKQTLYFYFSGLERSQQSVDSLVRWFLLNSLQSISGEMVHSSIKALFLNGDPTSLQLWKTFCDIMAELPTLIYLVIDGIDECHDSTGELFAHLLNILNSSPSLKIVLLGRPHVFEGQAAAQLIHINNDILQTDLKAFIIAETQKNEILRQSKIQGMVTAHLTEKADGMFLWVRLSVDELCDAYCEDDVKQMLRRLPLGLENTYDHILHEITKSNEGSGLESAQYILRFLVASGRMLEVKELQHAHALASSLRQPKSERDHLDTYKGPNPAAMFRRACRGLINIENEKVSLVHLTVKEYLTRPAAKWNPNISSLRIGLAEAHEFCAKICIENIDNDGFEWFHKREGIFLSEYPDCPPLFSYAFKFIPYHLNRMQGFDAETVTRVKNFCSTHSVFWFEMLIVSCFTEGPMAMTWQDFWEISELFVNDSLNMKDWTMEMKEQLRNIYRDRVKGFWPSQQLRLLGIISEWFDEDDSNTSHSISPPQEREYGRNEISDQPTQETLSQIIHLLADRHALPLLKQSDLLSKIGDVWHRVGHLKDLLSPFDMLFRLIKSKINSFPVIILIGIGEICRELKRPQNALEIHHMALARLDDNDEATRYQIWEFIGFCYSNIGNHKEAFNAHKRAWIGRQKILGLKHKKTADSIYWTGLSLHERGDYNEAEKCFRQAVSLHKEIYGDKHRETACCVFRLGLSLYNQQKYSETDQNFRNAISLYKAILGEHKDTANSIFCLGRSLYDQQIYPEAEQNFRNAASMETRVLGDHSNTANSKFWLGRSLYNQQKYSEAEQNFRNAISLYKAILGEHKDTATSIFWLGRSLYDQRDYTKAEKQFRLADRIYLKVPNTQHEDMLWNKLGLVKSLCCQLMYNQAENVLRPILNMASDNYADTSDVVIIATLWLARALYYQKKDDEAQTILTTLLSVKNSKHDVNNEYSLTVALFLSRSLSRQAKYGDAELIMRQVLIEKGNLGSSKISADAASEIGGIKEDYENYQGVGFGIEHSEDSENSEDDDDDENTRTGEQTDIDTEDEDDTEGGGGLEVSDEKWDLCALDNVLSEYKKTGRNLQRVGMQYEAEAVFSLLENIRWL